MKILLSIVIIFSFKFIYAQEAVTTEGGNKFLSLKAGFVHDPYHWPDHYINGIQPGFGFSRSRHIHSFGINNLQLTLNDDLYFIKDRFTIGLWYQYKFYFTKSKLNPYSSLFFNLLYKHLEYNYPYSYNYNFLEFRTLLLLGFNYKITSRFHLFVDAGFNVFHVKDILELDKEKRYNPYVESLTQGEINLGVSYHLK